jgi:tRNA threonylcarbamoyladenosine biosynthesis protein TsaB
MTTLLTIEAASDSCSVALQIGNDIIQKLEPAPRMHSRLLYPMLNSMMSEAGISPSQLDAVAFVNGPGSFTGLRIAAATAQGIGFACDIPLIGISTLQAMAQQAYTEKNQALVLPIMDARMNELYLGCYRLNPQTGIMVKQQEDRICAQDIKFEALAIDTAVHGIYGCGHGFKLTDKLSPDLLAACENIDAEQVLEAKYLIPMANALFNSKNTLLPEEVELVYLREQSHWKTIKEQKLLKKDR